MHSAVAYGCWWVGFEAFVAFGEVAFGINRRADPGTRNEICSLSRFGPRFIIHESGSEMKFGITLVNAFTVARWVSGC